MGNRYLVVSDLHLADVEDHTDGWKRHKSSRFTFDEELGELVSSFIEQGDRGDRLTLVLNGDIFDFDLVTATPADPPWPVSRRERRRGLDATADKSAWKLERILADHQGFIETLARFISAGHRLVYVMGNHDREFHFEQVQQAFVRAIERTARELQLSLLAGSMEFEPWFFYVPGEIYVEHGQQYDFYSSFRYQLCPLVRLDADEDEIALPMGNLSNRYLMSRMGFFNPHGGDFILNVFNYIAHWARHYALSRRGLVINWLLGSLMVIRRLLRIKRRLGARRGEHRARLERLARRHDLPTARLEALDQLRRPPITSRFYRLVRELWIDRLALALLMVGGTVTLALVSIPLWVKLMVPLTTFPLIYFIYEWFAEGETIFTFENELPQRAREVVETLPAQVVAFGHTHRPRTIPLDRNVTFVDTGTWAPVMARGSRDRLRPGRRNYLVAAFQRHELAGLELGSWLDQGLAPDEVGEEADEHQAAG